MKPTMVAREIGLSSKRTRLQLVRGLKGRGIRNSDVLAAIASVPRHMFVDGALARRSYEDIPLPIGFRQTISQPFIVALMSEKLISCSDRSKTVFEVGTGCGYQTAILAQLYEKVFSIERIQPLFERAERTLTALQVRNVELRYGDGYDGWTGRTAFDSILLTAAPEWLPDQILTQLAQGGCLVAPVGKTTNQRLRIVSNRHGRLYDETAEAVRFVPLVRGVSA